MKQKLVFVAPLNLFTGYGQHACKIIEGLDKAGFDIVVRPLETNQTLDGQTLKLPASITRHIVHRQQEEPWELLLFPPKHLPSPTKKVVYFTMWESTRLSVNQRTLVNKADVVIVPCEWNRKHFIESGITKPIRIVPLGIDTNLFKYSPPIRSNVYTFGCAGRIAHGADRKGLADVVTAFRIAFPRRIKDVCLKVKGFQDCAMAKPDDNRIVYDEKYFTPTEYVRWLQSLSCFVSAAKAEGWGWHQQEAMAVGRPLVACKYGGLAEFFNETCGAVVPHYEVPAQEVWKNLGLWAKPDMKAMVQAMRWMYLNREKSEWFGKWASQSACRFSNDFATERLIAVLKEFEVIK